MLQWLPAIRAQLKKTCEALSMEALRRQVVDCNWRCDQRAKILAKSNKETKEPFHQFERAQILNGNIGFWWGDDVRSAGYFPLHPL